jgi:hypothetical protein
LFFAFTVALLIAAGGFYRALALRAGCRAGRGYDGGIADRA